MDELVAKANGAGWVAIYDRLGDLAYIDSSFILRLAFRSSLDLR